MDDIFLNNLEDELNKSALLPVFNGFEQAYNCLVKLANELSNEAEEFKRIKDTVGKLPRDKMRNILTSTQISNLMNLNPPLESILIKHEESSERSIKDAFETISRDTYSRPVVAFKSLCFILKTIRNKRCHGFKTSQGPRDNEILSNAFSLVLSITKECIIFARR